MNKIKNKVINIVGGGLAGSELALNLANHGINVNLYEMRPKNNTPAHRTDLLGEIVCSNSFKSMEITNAHGLLKRELEILNSPLIKLAIENSLPAGKALAVDREKFSMALTNLITNHPNINLIREEVINWDSDDIVIFATGPLTSDKLLSFFNGELNNEGLFYFDAISPIVDAESLDLDYFFEGNRYDLEGKDYLNLPLSKDEYFNFVNALIDADIVPENEFEKMKYFEGCLPIEEMAKRGKNSLAFGPFKPVGFPQMFKDKKVYAIIQFRKEDEQGKAYNLVGCQTRLKYPVQKRVFRSLPGMSKAKFLRLGSMHKNVYFNFPKLVSKYPFIKSNIGLSGQIVGVEGYVESIMTSTITAMALFYYLSNETFDLPPLDTMTGALLNYVMSYKSKNFQPMNANFGIINLPENIRKIRNKKERKKKTAENAIEKINLYREQYGDYFE